MSLVIEIIEECRNRLLQLARYIVSATRNGSKTFNDKAPSSGVQ